MTDKADKEPSEVAKRAPEVSDVAAYNPSEYDLETDWETLVQEGDEALGHDLIKDSAIDKLAGVPFLIHRIYYRDGKQQKGSDYAGDFVTCEVVIAPARILKEKERKHRLLDIEGNSITVDSLSVAPGEHVVFNDSSTGIKRQITQYLYEKNLIGLPDPIIATGPAGTCSFDLPRSKWSWGADQATAGINIRLHCPRGVRPSKYENEYTTDGSTRYLG